MSLDVEQYRNRTISELVQQLNTLGHTTQDLVSQTKLIAVQPPTICLNNNDLNQQQSRQEHIIKRFKTKSYPFKQFYMKVPSMLPSKSSEASSLKGKFPSTVSDSGKKYFYDEIYTDLNTDKGQSQIDSLLKNKFQKGYNCSVVLRNTKKSIHQILKIVLTQYSSWQKSKAPSSSYVSSYQSQEEPSSDQIKWKQQGAEKTSLQPLFLLLNCYSLNQQNQAYDMITNSKVTHRQFAANAKRQFYTVPMEKDEPGTSALLSNMKEFLGLKGSISQHSVAQKFILITFKHPTMMSELNLIFIPDAFFDPKIGQCPAPYLLVKNQLIQILNYMKVHPNKKYENLSKIITKRHQLTSFLAKKLITDSANIVINQINNEVATARATDIFQGSLDFFDRFTIISNVTKRVDPKGFSFVYKNERSLDDNCGDNLQKLLANTTKKTDLNKIKQIQIMGSLFAQEVKNQQKQVSVKPNQKPAENFSHFNSPKISSKPYQPEQKGNVKSKSEYLVTSVNNQENRSPIYMLKQYQNQKDRKQKSEIDYRQMHPSEANQQSHSNYNGIVDQKRRQFNYCRSLERKTHKYSISPNFNESVQSGEEISYLDHQEQSRALSKNKKSKSHQQQFHSPQLAYQKTISKYEPNPCLNQSSKSNELDNDNEEVPKFDQVENIHYITGVDKTKNMNLQYSNNMMLNDKLYENCKESEKIAIIQAQHQRQISQYHQTIQNLNRKVMIMAKQKGLEELYKLHEREILLLELKIRELRQDVLKLTMLNVRTVQQIPNSETDKIQSEQEMKRSELKKEALEKEELTQMINRLTEQIKAHQAKTINSIQSQGRLLMIQKQLAQTKATLASSQKARSHLSLQLQSMTKRLRIRDTQLAQLNQDDLQKYRIEQQLSITEQQLFEDIRELIKAVNLGQRHSIQHLLRKVSLVLSDLSKSRDVILECNDFLVQLMEVLEQKLNEICPQIVLDSNKFIRAFIMDNLEII